MKAEGQTSLQFNPSARQQIIIEKTELDIGFCLIALATKAAPIFFFFAFSQFKILGFTFVLIAASIDFWLFKNITGRKLAGMTWWMKVNLKTGDEEWIFHTQNQEQNQINQNVFWGLTFFSAIFWGSITLISLIVSQFFWIVLCMFCLLLSGINLAFFYKCKGRHQEIFKQIADKMGLTSANTLVNDY